MAKTKILTKRSIELAVLMALALVAAMLSQIYSSSSREFVQAAPQHITRGNLPKVTKSFTQPTKMTGQFQAAPVDVSLAPIDQPPIELPAQTSPSKPAEKKTAPGAEFDEGSLGMMACALPYDENGNPITLEDLNVYDEDGDVIFTMSYCPEWEEPVCDDVSDVEAQPASEDETSVSCNAAEEYLDETLPSDTAGEEDTELLELIAL
jgi:hypothetical protein